MAADLAAREEALVPFAVAYRVEVTKGGKPTGRSALEGTAAWGRGRRAFRFIEQEKTGRAILEDREPTPAELRRREVLVLAGGETTLTAWRALEPEPRPWRGSRSKAGSHSHIQSPAAVGLFFANEPTLPIAAILGRREARAVRRELRAGHPCLVVDTQWLPASPRRTPLRIWLAEDLGHSPLRMEERWGPSDQVYPDLPDEGAETVDGVTYRLRTVVEVERLERTPQGWFPVEGRVEWKSRSMPEGWVLRIVCDPATLRLGDAVRPSDFELPRDILRLPVQDRIHGGTELLGSAPMSLENPEVLEAWIWTVLWVLAVVAVIVWRRRHRARHRRAAAVTPVAPR